LLGDILTWGSAEGGIGDRTQGEGWLRGSAEEGRSDRTQGESIFDTLLNLGAPEEVRGEKSMDRVDGRVSADIVLTNPLTTPSDSPKI